MTYADILRPVARAHARLYDAVLIVGGSLLIALSARVVVPLPFSPVPITGQTLAVLLVGALLGSRRGTLCLLAYLVEGCAGMPVFAPGGAPGLARLLGPTGGYLVGFVAAAYVTGRLAEAGWDRRIVTTVVAMVLGNLVIYTCGVLGLSIPLGLDLGRALAAGLYPFLPGDLVKIVLAALLLPAGWALPGFSSRQ